MRRIVFLILITFSKTIAVAQTTSTQFNLPNVIEIAPNAAGIGRYGEIPVSINTGVPDISIPLYTLKTSALTLPISVSYHASGIKVKDMSSSVGLGWSLNAGGSISRVVQGVDDYGAYGFSSMLFPDNNDPLITTKEKCIAANICNTEDGEVPTWDGQPDLFYYNFGTKSGKFILKNLVTSSISPGFMTIPYDPIKISLSGSQFTLINTDGVAYIFGKGSPLTDTCYDITHVEVSGLVKPNTTTGYHLTSIISNDKSDTINLSSG